MFEKFSRNTVLAVHAAVKEAQDSAASTIDEEHLVYALFREPDTLAAQLTGGEMTLAKLRESFARAHRRGGVSETDLETLRGLGIDMSEVESAVANQLGAEALTPKASTKRRRHLPFTPDAKDVLAGALREARQRRDKRIGDDHMLLSLLGRGGLAAGVLTELGTSYETVSARVE